jgi:heme-degrading monooxygenase HmoA
VEFQYQRKEQHPVSQHNISVINVFTPKPGRLDDFVSLQQSTLPGMRGRVAGFQGSRFYRATDGRSAVLVSNFESEAHFKQFRESELFAAHRERLSPLLEKTDPGFYELVFETV